MSHSDATSFSIERSMSLPAAASSSQREAVRPDRSYAVASRALDIAVAIIALVVTLPIILLAAVAIKLTSRGPVFFYQKRAGLHQTPFTMFKLRTMYPGADDDKELFRKFNALPTGPCFKMKNDPRVTPIGRWLRRTSIDELPQDEYYMWMKQFKEPGGIFEQAVELREAAV